MIVAKVPLTDVLHSWIALDFTRKALQATIRGKLETSFVAGIWPKGWPPLVVLYNFCIAQTRRHSNRRQRREAVVAQTNKRGSGWKEPTSTVALCRRCTVPNHSGQISYCVDPSQTFLQEYIRITFYPSTASSFF